MLDKSSFLSFEVDDQLIGEFFNRVKTFNEVDEDPQKKAEKISNLRNYFKDPKYKVWTLKDEADYTVLHRAVFMNSEELVKLIIEELKLRLGFEAKSVLENFVNEKTVEGMTALHYAAYRGNIKIAKILFNHGASVDVFSSRGKNVMHMCAEGNQPAMLIYFINYHAQDIVSIDEYGSTPLHWACYSGAEEAVAFLLSFNADINRQDKEGLTPLHLAVLSNNEKIVLKLLQNGADKTIENYKKEIPLTLASKKKYRKIISLLEDKTYNKLCSLETPIMFIQPENFYKYVIFILMLFPEIGVVLLILPYLNGNIHTMVNMSLWGISLFFYIILIGMNPGEMHNPILFKELQPNENPLCHLVDSGVNIVDYCPTCFVIKTPNSRHCILCNRCIDGWSHHCFWINKCIGKKNTSVYMLFILFSMAYSYHCILFSFFGFTVDPSEKKLFPPQLFSLDTNTYLVLCSACIFIFNILVSYPLLSVFLIQICKSFKFFDKPKEGDKPKKGIQRIETEIELKDKVYVEDNSKEECLLEKREDSLDAFASEAINDNSSSVIKIGHQPRDEEIPRNVIQIGHQPREEEEVRDDLKDDVKKEEVKEEPKDDSDEEIQIVKKNKGNEEPIKQEDVEIENKGEEENQELIEEDRKDEPQERVENKQEEQVEQPKKEEKEQKNLIEEEEQQKKQQEQPIVSNKEEEKEKENQPNTNDNQQEEDNQQEDDIQKKELNEEQQDDNDNQEEGEEVGEEPKEADDDF